MELPEKTSHEDMENLVYVLKHDNMRMAFVDDEHRATRELSLAVRVGFFRDGKLVVSYKKRADGLWERKKAA